MVLTEDMANIRLAYVPTADENRTFAYFKEKEQQIVADLHGQDPKVILHLTKSFMPEKAGYFRIVDTRGVIYTILAKLLLYIFLAFGIIKVVFGYFTTTPKNYITKTLSNERTIMGKKFKKRYAVVVCISFLLFIYMFIISFSMLVITSDNKANFYNTGMDLKYKNTDIVNNVKEAEQYIIQINSAKQTLRNSTLATDQFVLKNNMPSIVKSISAYSKKASDLNDNILTDSILVGVSL